MPYGLPGSFASLEKKLRKCLIFLVQKIGKKSKKVKKKLPSFFSFMPISLKFYAIL